MAFCMVFKRHTSVYVICVLILFLEPLSEMGQKKINTVLLNLEQAEVMVAFGAVEWREWITCS